MSVLVIDADLSERSDPYLDAVVVRLIAQGDEVRVIEHPDRPGGGERWQARGAYVARGPRLDHDLIDRAAQNVRTIVLIDVEGRYDDELLEAVIDGARFASVERVVLCGGRRAQEPVDALGASGLQHVIMWIGPRRRLRDSRASPESVAAAVDAADDMAGEPRLELELTDPDAWAELRLAPPPGA